MLFHVIKIYTKITWSILNLYIFSDIKESSRGWEMNLDDEYQNILISLYSSLAMKVRRRNFDSSHHINLRRRRWAMELIAAVGTKLKDPNKQTTIKNFPDE